MPYNKQPGNELLKSAEDMGFSLELRKISSKWQSSSKTKENSVLPQPNRTPKDGDKLKSKGGVAPQRSDHKLKGKQDSDGKIQNRDSANRNITETDELVKHMSNLPGYLLRPDRGVQEKAFNVGVLDWSRLEKWNHKHHHIPVLASNFTSLNSSESSPRTATRSFNSNESSSRTATKSFNSSESSSRIAAKSFRSSESSSRTATKSSTSIGSKEKRDDQRGLLSSGVGPSYRECLPEKTKPPFQNVKRIESSKSETKSIRGKQRMAPWEFESFGKTHLDISLEKGRRNDHNKRTSQVGNSASNLRHHVVSHVPNEKASDRNDGAKQNMDDLQEYNHNKKERKHKPGSDMGMPSVKSKNKGVSVNSKKTSSSSSGTSKRVDQVQESDFGIGHKHCHSKPSNTVLYHQESRPSSSSEDFRLSELRTSSDENFSESSQSSLSYVSLPDEVYTENICPEIPYSGSLRSAVEPTSSLETMQHNTSTNQDIGRSSVVSETPSSTNKRSILQSVGTCLEKDVLETKLRNQHIFSNIKESLDQETAELNAHSGMNSSHNRRFSFSLSRIGRSFSFKEGPTLPQFSTTYVSAKSGPVTPASSVRWDNSSKEKANGHNRTRSSPLRRLLDPIWKYKTSGIHHSAESSQIQKGSMSSVSFSTIGVNESLNAEKSKGSSVQGLLQLTIKNEQPLFKFVLNNERKILAATKRSLSSLVKDDLGCYFTFYLVNEIKKKSGGWISHGSKEKSCGYAYNIVAQMKFSSSKITEPINQNSKRQRIVKEYVLSGVEIGQTEQGPPKFIQSREIAAVIIETPYENSSNEGLHNDSSFLKKGCMECLADDRCFCNSGENDMSISTTVILPGGVHGSPTKGEPSPLIYRWKTGGSCDCGGWDIGCKLLVLSNLKQRSNIPKHSKPYQDRFQLFSQEGAEKNTPLFTLSPLKDGFYSVEFNSAITYLQAFFISVAVLSCQKLPSSLENGSMLEEILKEPSSKTNNRLQGKAPVKYTPIPPLSPVGRV